jgi:hypothetical protein
MQQRFVGPENESRSTSGELSEAARGSRLSGDSQSTSAAAGETRALAEQVGVAASRAALETSEVTEPSTIESKRRAYELALLTQPAAAWSLLVAVAAVTGVLSIDNPSIRQPILLHAIPQLLALVAGYRLKDIRKGALSGASFHVARGLLILLLSAWPRFAEVVADNPAQMAWLFLLPPALGAFGGWLGSVRQQVAARRGFAPIATSLAAASMLVASTTAGIAPRFLQGGRAMVPGIPPLASMPAPAFPFFSESGGQLTVGDSTYDYSFQVTTAADRIDAIARVNAPGTNAALLTPDQMIRSADGATTVAFNRSGELVWNQGKREMVITAAKEPLSQLSLSQDGNMVVFRQGEDFMVFTPSKGLRGVEDLVRQFWQDPLFEVADGTVVAAGFGRDTNALNLVFPSEDGDIYTATLRMDPQGTAAPPGPPPGTEPAQPIPDFPNGGNNR